MLPPPGSDETVEEKINLLLSKVLPDSFFTAALDSLNEFKLTINTRNFLMHWYYFLRGQILLLKYVQILDFWFSPVFPYFFFTLL